MDTEQTKNSTEVKNNFKKTFLDKFTKFYGTKNDLELQKVKIKITSKDVRCKAQKLSIGNPSPHHPTKVILLVGATGSGKTTLINAMVNFIFRVDFQDDFRLILINKADAPVPNRSESKTAIITAYAFNHMPGMPFDYNYVLIDTPGFGDIRGIERDQELMNQLEYFLQKEDYGIDCVGFVISASEGRLTPTQHYVLDGLKSMFGKDLKDNICIMVTFSSTEDVEPPVLAALKEADVPYKGVFKFNSSVYAKPGGPVSEYFWNYSNDSLQEFLYNLGKSLPVSLTLTKEVLKKRRQLQGIVIGLQNCIQFGLSLLANLHQERELLSKVTEDIGRCASYVEEVDVPRINKFKINSKTYEKTTNNEKFGLNCNLNFKPVYNFKEMIASVANIDLEVGYESNNTTEKTREQELTYKITYVKEKRTVPELFNRYNILQNSAKSKEAIIKRIEEEIDCFTTEVICAIKSAQQHVNNLEKIALKPNQTSTIEYIEILIESEEVRRETNFLKRNEILELMKRKLQSLRV